MKKIKKSGIALLIGGLLIGGVSGYAATNIFGNLDQIWDNYDITFNFAKDKQAEVIRLQDELENASSGKTQLESEINALKQDIEQLKIDHGVEITNKNEEITNKQKEIDAKQIEVNEKQSVINDLTGQLSNLQGEMAHVEAQVTNLLNRTNAGVQELTGGE